MNDQVAAPEVGVLDPQDPPNPDPSPEPLAPAPADPPAPVEETVTMSRAEHNQMLGAMAQMQNFINDVQQRPPEPQLPAPNVPAAKHPDEMTGSELLAHIQSQTQPLVQTVMAMAVAEELREAKGKFGDFDQYHQEVMKLASNNLELSLQDAYHLAKAQNPKPATTPVTPVALAPAPPPPARKTSTPAPSVTEKTTMTVTEAARAAALELGLKD